MSRFDEETISNIKGTDPVAPFFISKNKRNDICKIFFFFKRKHTLLV